MTIIQTLIKSFFLTVLDIEDVQEQDHQHQQDFYQEAYIDRREGYRNGDLTNGTDVANFDIITPVSC